MKNKLIRGLVITLTLVLYLLSIAMISISIKVDEPDIKHQYYKAPSNYGAIPICDTVTISIEKGYFVNMKTTAYCACSTCCGWSTGITASGTIATAGKTVAANLNYYPIGTRIMINGREYIVEDTGGGLAANQLDIFFDDHQEALNYGVQYVNVKILED